MRHDLDLPGRREAISPRASKAARPRLRGIVLRGIVEMRLRCLRGIVLRGIVDIRLESLRPSPFNY